MRRTLKTHLAMQWLLTRYATLRMCITIYGGICMEVPGLLRIEQAMKLQNALPSARDPPPEPRTLNSKHPGWTPLQVCGIITFSRCWGSLGFRV